MSYELSCALVPGRHTPAHAAAAEQLGYSRVWIYDSPSMYQELWFTLGRIAERTDTIGLATGVASTSLRHVMVTASALVSLESCAPGRVTFGVGVGGTSTLMLGRQPDRWDHLRAYVNTVRGLLRGKIMEWEGKPIRLTLPAGEAQLPVEIPIIIAAEGPRGEAVAGQHGDGIYTIYRHPRDSFSWSSRLVYGTVLEPYEQTDSDRVYEAAGPGAALPYRVSYAFKQFDQVAALPNGQAFLDDIDSLSDNDRQSILWKGQSVHLSDFDRNHIPREAIAALTVTGSAENVARRLHELVITGISEIVYSPAGPNIERELEAFARAAFARN